MLEGICAQGLLPKSSSGNFVAFKATFKLPDENEKDFDPILMVSKDTVCTSKDDSLKADQPILSADFMLTDCRTMVNKAYRLSLMHPTLKDQFVAWQGFANMCKPEMQMAGK